MSHHHQFWLENLRELFAKNDLLPMSEMPWEEQFNAVTRLMLLVFLIVLIINTKWGFLFLLFSLSIIISLYYIQRSRMKDVRENFGGPRYLPQAPPNNASPSVNIPLAKGLTVPQGARLGEMDWSGNNIKLETPEQYRWCKDTVWPKFGPQYASSNQKLAGPPNPKTQIAPVVISPPASLDYWRANPLVRHSHINTESQNDIYQMGYVVSTCCGNLPENTHAVKADVKYTPPYETESQPKENYTNYFDTTPPAPAKSHQTSCGTIIEPNVYQYPYQNQTDKAPYVGPPIDGGVMIACGYNPDQTKVNLPSNYGTGNCEQNPAFKDYNKNVFTQTIQPGVYTQNQIIEPINSNIGISWTQQFPPTTCNLEGDNSVYTQHDPRLMKPEEVQPNLSVINAVNNSNVYDPRFYGYGTGYRSYIEKTTGQPRFMYDDVDAIRRPNYLVRSKIDFEPYADSYGPLKNEDGNEYNSDIRALANDSFMRNTIKQRNDLQERLMRKVNANRWQQRLAPHGARMASANISCKAVGISS